MLDHGRWEGRQVVDSAWVAEAASVRSTANFNMASYGYYFWVFPSYPAFAAEGHGGQFIFVAPEQNLVIVYTAWGYTGIGLWDEFSGLADLIMSSCD